MAQNPYLSDDKVNVMPGLQQVDMSQKNVNWQNYGQGPEQVYFKPLPIQQFDVQKNNFGQPGDTHSQIMGRGQQTYTQTSKSRVICNELVRQGLFTKKELVLEFKHCQKLPEEVIIGYHVWAIPYVKLMRKSTIATNVIEKLAKIRHKEVEYKMGESEKGSILGKVLRYTGEPLCYIAGFIAKKLFKFDKDKYMSLYNENGDLK